MRKLLALLLAILSPTLTLAQSTGMRSAPDPFYLNENDPIFRGPLPSRDVNAKVLTAQTINTSVQNCILIGAGQSNSPGTIVAPTAFVPVNTNALDFLNPYDGAIYRATDPIIGSGASTPTSIAVPLLRVSDALVTAGKCSRVIILAIGIGGTAIADWAVGTFKDRIPVTMRRILALYTTTGANVACGVTNITCVILWGQGETDNALGTSSVSYQASYVTLKANAAAAGFVGRWLIATQTYFALVTSAPIQAAQAAIRNGSDVLAGANGDVFVGNVCNGTSACRGVDAEHWSDAGSISYATDPTNGWVQALHASGAPF